MKNLQFLIGFIPIIFQVCYAQPVRAYSISDHFISSGYMGDIKNIIVRNNYRDNTGQDSLCTKISYSPGELGWGGCYLQYPANNWCRLPGRNLSNSGYTRITVYMKGERGGEEVRFKVGQDCGDTFVSDEITQRLTTTWTQLTISLERANLSNITGAFCWIVDSKANNGVVTFYIDQIQIE